MKCSGPENLITDCSGSLEPGNNHLSNNLSVPVRTTDWTFKKDAGDLAYAVATKLQIQKQLSDMNAPVEKLLNYSHTEQNGTHIVRAEFEAIPNCITPKWRQVGECLDAMIASFSALTHLHANNIYHGNPCTDHFIFQNLNNAQSRLPLLKGYLGNFDDCGHINGDPTLSAKDVQIALSDFGGRLLMVAENSSYTKIRVLKMHLESQVNFADQEELDALENAPTLLEHLRSLKALLNLRHNDYPHQHAPVWGPLSQEQVLTEYQALQKRNQESARIKMASIQFKLPPCPEVKLHKQVEPTDPKPTSSRLEEFKKRFCTLNSAGAALLTAGAVVTLLSMREKKTDKPT